MALFLSKNICNYLLFLVFLMFFGCNKDQKTNRKLDGTWTVKSTNGHPPAEAVLHLLYVSKSKHGRGSGKFLYPQSSSSSLEFSYEIKEDVLSLDLQVEGNDTILKYQVEKAKSKELILIDSQGVITEYEPQ